VIHISNTTFNINVILAQVIEYREACRHQMRREKAQRIAQTTAATGTYKHIHQAAQQAVKLPPSDQLYEVRRKRVENFYDTKMMEYNTMATELEVELNLVYGSIGTTCSTIKYIGCGKWWIEVLEDDGKRMVSHGNVWVDPLFPVGISSALTDEETGESTNTALIILTNRDTYKKDSGSIIKEWRKFVDTVTQSPRKVLTRDERRSKLARLQEQPAALQQAHDAIVSESIRRQECP